MLQHCYYQQQNEWRTQQVLSVSVLLGLCVISPSGYGAGSSPEWRGRSDDLQSNKVVGHTISLWPFFLFYTERQEESWSSIFSVLWLALGKRCSGFSDPCGGKILVSMAGPRAAQGTRDRRLGEIQRETFVSEAAAEASILQYPFLSPQTTEEAVVSTNTRRGITGTWRRAAPQKHRAERSKHSCCHKTAWQKV